MIINYRYYIIIKQLKEIQIIFLLMIVYIIRNDDICNSTYYFNKKKIKTIEFKLKTIKTTN